jgi:stage II sporulation protein D
MVCIPVLALCAGAQDVRIGVLGLFHPKKVIVNPLEGKSLECSSGSLSWNVAAPLRASLQQPHGIVVPQSLQALNKPVRCNVPGNYAEFTLAIPGKITRRYVGSLELTALSSELEIVVTMPLETAVASVVAAESLPETPMEALKAQAIASRSFLAAGKGSHREFDFCDTTHCEFLRSPPLVNSGAYQAALQTRGLVLAYDGAAFAAMYSRSCGGRTHSLEELGIPVRNYPYFAVACDYCRRHPEKWTLRIDEGDAAALNGTESSRLKLASKLGWRAIPSDSYSKRRESDSLVLEGVGVGHGLGLCQRGAADMARRGASFREILTHYYPNTTLKLLP